MKTIEEFYNEAMTNETLAYEINKAHEENRLAVFLAEHEVSGTAEEFVALIMKKRIVDNVLSDEDMDQVSGGKVIAPVGVRRVSGSNSSPEELNLSGCAIPLVLFPMGN